MVDTKCSFLKGKYRKQENTALSSDGHIEDETLLRQPMRTSCAGFKEAKKAYENGTDEVRRLLMQECSLIYECNVCRNMFRSLSNFISHKRNYCKNITADKIHLFPDRSSSLLIQSIDRSEPLLMKSRSTGSSPIPNTKSSNRDLSKVIERLKRVEVSSGCSSHNTSVVENTNTKASSPELKIPDPVLELERVSTTTQAVYQTFKTKNNTDSIKTELDEVQSLLANQKIVLGPDGKAIVNSSLRSFTPSTVSDGRQLTENTGEAVQVLASLSCEICKMKFQTEKTLRIHVQKNHTATTYVFQCPMCSMTFLQPAAVIRHLANEHKKPLRRIRKMRDTILKKRIQIGDVQVKGLAREVKRLQMSYTKDLVENTSMMLDQQTERSITSCMYCLKNFERRAALAAHLANCPSRKTLFSDAKYKSRKFSSMPNASRNEVNTQKVQSSNKILEFKSPNNKIGNGDEAVGKIDIKQELSQDDLDSTNSPANVNKLFENLENQTFGNGLRTVCLDKIEMIDELKEINGEEPTNIKTENSKEHISCDDQSIEENTKNNVISRCKATKKDKTKRFRIVSASKQLTCRCKICNKQFNALSNLRRHISMFHYRSKRFGCKLCEYRAFRRYDIVNHLTFVHKMTDERESMAVEYVTVHDVKYSKDDVEGDIVVVNNDDEGTVTEHHASKITEEQKHVKPEINLKTYENKEKRNKILSQSNNDKLQSHRVDLIPSKDKCHGKVIRRKLKKSLEQQVDDKKRPIRNRIKTVNKDFVYDLLATKEESKKTSRLTLKRRNTSFVDQNNLSNIEFTPPPIKITPYRLRTEPLMPSDKCCVRGAAANVCRKAIHEGLAAPSTLPELPTERPQMRTRLISASRMDTNAVPIIETSKLEAAGLKSTFFDDSFLEKFAKKSNPSFKMKPLLALQHSPLDSILQKFDASQQNNNIHKRENDTSIFENCPEENNSSPPDFTICLLQGLTQPNLKEKGVTPNGKQISDLSSTPAAPKKRITLMERLAENRARAKRRNSLICTTLEN